MISQPARPIGLRGMRIRPEESRTMQNPPPPPPPPGDQPPPPPPAYQPPPVYAPPPAPLAYPPATGYPVQVAGYAPKRLSGGLWISVLTRLLDGLILVIPIALLLGILAAVFGGVSSF